MGDKKFDEPAADGEVRSACNEPFDDVDDNEQVVDVSGVMV